MNRKFSCHRISEGVVTGRALISEDAIMFYLLEPSTGVMIEPHHSIEGKSVAGKILIFPGGKGSSVVQADGLFQLKMKDNLPLAMVIEYPETVLVSSAIIMDVPLVDKVDPDFYQSVKNGDLIRVDANNQTIEILS